MSDINILVRDIPKETDRIINTISRLRGVPKWEITREALIEYAKNHQKDIIKLARSAQNE